MGGRNPGTQGLPYCKKNAIHSVSVTTVMNDSPKTPSTHRHSLKMEGLERKHLFGCPRIHQGEDRECMIPLVSIVDETQEVVLPPRLHQLGESSFHKSKLGYISKRGMWLCTTLHIPHLFLQVAHSVLCPQTKSTYSLY